MGRHPEMVAEDHVHIVRGPRGLRLVVVRVRAVDTVDVAPPILVGTLLLHRNILLSLFNNDI